MYLGDIVLNMGDIAVYIVQVVGGAMDRVSDDRLQELINWVGYRVGLTEWKDGVWVDAKRALTELRERREAEKEQLARLNKKVDDGMEEYHKAPCPEHAKMVAEWEEMG